MLTKQFFKSKKKANDCKVTFELPKDVEAKSVALVGDFNDWNPEANPLKKVRGVWKTSVELEKGQEYQFRYFVDGSEWLNDTEADKYIPNGVGDENSVVITTNGSNGQ